MVKLFGSTIAESISAFKPVQLGGDQNVSTSEDKIKAIGRLIVTVMLICIAAYCLTTDKKEVGSTLLGAIVGYWLK